jgi:hypothetical protein
VDSLGALLAGVGALLLLIEVVPSSSALDGLTFGGRYAGREQAVQVRHVGVEG